MEQSKTYHTLGNRSGEWKELVSKAEQNLGVVHDFRTTRQLEDNRKGLEQQEQGQMESEGKGNLDQSGLKTPKCSVFICEAWGGLESIMKPQTWVSEVV